MILLVAFRPAQGRHRRKNSLRPVAAARRRGLGRPVGFADDCIGAAAEAAIATMKDGDILLLENTRFHKGEEKNDPAFVEELAKLGDIYVNDAFSAAHRAHASTEGVAHKLPAYAGRAMQAELDALAKRARQSGASGGRDRRRRQGLDQARAARQPGQQGRRR